MDEQKVRKRIVNRMKEIGVTRHDLALCANTTPQGLGHKMKFPGRTRVASLSRIAILLHLPLEVLLAEDEQQYPLPPSYYLRAIQTQPDFGFGNQDADPVEWNQYLAVLESYGASLPRSNPNA
jgi:hypothetical protein